MHEDRALFYNFTRFGFTNLFPSRSRLALPRRWPTRIRGSQICDARECPLWVKSGQTVPGQNPAISAIERIEAAADDRARGVIIRRLRRALEVEQ